MTGDRLAQLGCLACVFFPPAVIIWWLIPKETWDKWAKRFF